MKLQCPIKRGIKVKQWYATNRDLKSLVDFYLCQSQGFGENQRDYASIGLTAHNGLDIAYENGTEVFASHDGTATYQMDGMSGLGIVIKTEGYKTIYWHLKEAVKPLWSTWEVKRGQLIGWGDSTGYSTGPHLHYGLKLLDNAGNVLNRDNGLDGAIDPTPYIVWWDMLDKDDVRFLQAIEGYSDPAGVDYWGDGTHTLKEYIKARVPHKISELTKLNI